MYVVRNNENSTTFDRLVKPSYLTPEHMCTSEIGLDEQSYIQGG